MNEKELRKRLQDAENLLRKAMNSNMYTWERSALSGEIGDFLSLRDMVHCPSVHFLCDCEHSSSHKRTESCDGSVKHICPKCVPDEKKS
jgi:hypothetical protein